MTPVKKAMLAASLAAATSVTAYFEGRSLVGYLDPVGIPTICYGHTATARMGMELDEEECQRLLAEDLGWALGAVDRHLPHAPPLTRAALGSFTYNVGVGAFERSTLLRKARSGDWVGACNELPRWVYAGGKKLRGLERRREAERELCLEGLKHARADRGDSGPAAGPGWGMVPVGPYRSAPGNGAARTAAGCRPGGQPAQNTEAAA